MTKSLFRVILIVSTVLGLTAGTIDLIFPSLLPESYLAVQSAMDEIMPIFPGILMLSIFTPLYIISIVGLYRFRHWAPLLAIVVTALSIAVTPFFGPYMMSGLAFSLDEIASYLWGVVLILTYLPPYRVWFAKSSDAK